MGIPTSWYQPKHFRRQRRSGARRIGLERHWARSAFGRVRNVQVCYGRWAQTPVRLGLDRRAGLSVLPRWGCDVLIFRGRA